MNNGHNLIVESCCNTKGVAAGLENILCVACVKETCLCSAPFKPSPLISLRHRLINSPM